MSEVNPLAIALIGVIGGILSILIGLLISMVSGLKKDSTAGGATLIKKIEEIQARLEQMVPKEEYRADRKEVILKLDEHGDRILLLEVRVKPA
jgi:hypothetical protein